MTRRERTHLRAYLKALDYYPPLHTLSVADIGLITGTLHYASFRLNREATHLLRVFVRDFNTVLLHNSLK